MISKKVCVLLLFPSFLCAKHCIYLTKVFLFKELSRSKDEIFFFFLNLDLVLRNSAPGEFAYV